MRAAEDRHWWYVGLQNLLLRVVKREAGRFRRPLDILDAGCGTGRLAELLQRFGAVTACDMNPLALEAAEQRGIPRVLRCDLAADDLGESVYDLVTCVDVLYHRAITDALAVLRRLRRSLRDGGCLIVHVPAFECLRGAHDVAVHTERRYRRRELECLLQEAGFVVECSSYRLLALFVPALPWRWLTRVCPRCAGNGEPLSDLAAPIPVLLNGLLAAFVKGENGLLLAGVRLPVGTSVFALARKPVSPNRLF
jgi:SAM-dependent methyltransferase